MVKKAYLFALIGLSAHTLFLVARGIAGDRMPVANLYEFVLLFTWGTALLFVIMQQRYPVKGIGAPVMLVVSMLLIYAWCLNTPYINERNKIRMVAITLGVNRTFNRLNRLVMLNSAGFQQKTALSQWITFAGRGQNP